MKTFLASEDTTVAVPLTRNGEPFVPDNSQIFWELRGHDGAILSPKTALNGIEDSTALIVVGAVHAEITPGRNLEKRTLIVTGAAEGRPFDIRHGYRIAGFLNHSSTEADVRKFIGVDEGELPDDDIDITAAYFDVADTAGFDVLATALAGDDKTDRAANRAIVAQAVINLLPSLPARVSKKESDGTSEAERFPVDFAELEKRARGALSRALSTISPAAATVAPALVVLTTRTDPLTGN